MLSDKEIYENLCYYDERNPNGISDPELVGVKEGCDCENCFYGRTKLATALLEARSGMFTAEEMQDFADYVWRSDADKTVAQDFADWKREYKKEREHGEA